MNNGIFQILQYSKYYQSIESKYEEYKRLFCYVTPDEKHQTVLKIIDNFLKSVLSNYKGNKIEFQNYDDNKDFCFKIDNKYVFSHVKLNEDADDKWKFWILIKILQLEKLKIEDWFDKLKTLF